jgi:FtsH-binding integral membrane protein
MNITLGVSVGTGHVCTGLCSIADTIIYLINGVLVPLLFAVSFIVFLYGVAKTYIFSHGEDAAAGHKIILWGLIGFAAMISVWGMVNVVADTFGLAGIGAPQQLPTSY